MLHFGYICKAQAKRQCGKLTYGVGINCRKGTIQTQLKLCLGQYDTHHVNCVPEKPWFSSTEIRLLGWCDVMLGLSYLGNLRVAWSEDTGAMLHFPEKNKVCTKYTCGSPEWNGEFDFWQLMRNFREFSRISEDFWGQYGFQTASEVRSYLRLEIRDLDNSHRHIAYMVWPFGGLRNHYTLQKGYYRVSNGLWQ